MMSMRSGGSTSRTLLAVVVAAAALAVAANGQQAGGGQPSLRCASTFSQACGDTNTTAGRARCCAGMTALYNNDTACLCTVFAAVNASSADVLAILNACGVDAGGSSPCLRTTVPSPAPTPSSSGFGTPSSSPSLDHAPSSTFLPSATSSPAPPSTAPASSAPSTAPASSAPSTAPASSPTEIGGGGGTPSLPPIPSSPSESFPTSGDAGNGADKFSMAGTLASSLSSSVFLFFLLS